MATFTFSTIRDATFYRKRDAERFRLYCKPRRWLVETATITKNIYGEPGEPVTGTDGVTSIPATRQLVSSSSNFITSGVAVSDVLEIVTESAYSDDNGRYVIDQVVNATTLKINQDWPTGSISGLKFKVFFGDKRYTDFGQEIQFVIKLNPTEKELQKWGINEYRSAKIVLSVELCESIGLVPKIGDRFVYTYGERNIHYEVLNLFESDQLGDSGLQLHYTGFAERTHERIEPV